MSFTIYHQIVIELRDCVDHIKNLGNEIEHIQISVRCLLKMQFLLCSTHPELIQSTLPYNTRIHGGFKNKARRQYSEILTRLEQLKEEEDGLIEERMLWIFLEREIRRVFFASGVVNENLEPMYYDL